MLDVSFKLNDAFVVLASKVFCIHPFPLLLLNMASVLSWNWDDGLCEVLGWYQGA